MEECTGGRRRRRREEEGGGGARGASERPLVPPLKSSETTVFQSTNIGRVLVLDAAGAGMLLMMLPSTATCSLGPCAPKIRTPVNFCFKRVAERLIRSECGAEQMAASASNSSSCATCGASLPFVASRRPSTVPNPAQLASIREMLGDASLGIAADSQCRMQDAGKECVFHDFPSLSLCSHAAMLQDAAKCASAPRG